MGYQRGVHCYDIVSAAALMPYRPQGLLLGGSKVAIHRRTFLLKATISPKNGRETHKKPVILD